LSARKTIVTGTEKRNRGFALRDLMDNQPFFGCDNYLALTGAAVIKTFASFSPKKVA
jgi:hypothetical protein